MAGTACTVIRKLRGKFLVRILAMATLGSAVPVSGASNAGSGGSAPPPPRSPPPSSQSAASANVWSRVDPQPLDSTQRMGDRERSARQFGANDSEPLHLIIFPPNPPPLGAQLNTNAASALLASRTPEGLHDEMLEPYFAPLSTWLVESTTPINKSLQTRLGNYQTARQRLLAELRQRITSLVSADPETRQAGFSALAGAQTAELTALETEADNLRREFGRNANWYARRQWRLGNHEYKLPREQTRVLECQLLRAAAFYQEGLSPGQRRLAREAAELLESSVFLEQETAVPANLLPYFSPDLMRVPPPAGVSPEVAALFEHYTTLKDALRDELRDAIYTNDALGARAREKNLHALAHDHDARLAALETLAETIREQLAPQRAAWRRTPPRPLPQALSDQIEEYLRTKRRLQAEYYAYVRPVGARLPPPETRGDPEALRRWQEQHEVDLAQATQAFVDQRKAAVVQLSKLLALISNQLPPYLSDLDGALVGSSDHAQLMEFVRRHGEQQAYFEFDVAAFEPGLSPAQRRLLFAGAVVRLDLPLAGPERQPSESPKTLLR